MHKPTKRLFSIIGITLLIVSSVITAYTPVAKASGFNIQVGYYVGNGTTQTVTNIGFKPDMIIIKGDTNLANAAAVLKTSAMLDNVTAYFNNTSLHTTTMIELLDDGFTVNSHAAVNRDNARYTWTAFSGSDCTANGSFCVGSYTGNTSTTQAITTGFEPTAIITTRGFGGVHSNFRTAEMDDDMGQYFFTSEQNTSGGLYTTINSDGYTAGSINNVSGGTFYFVAFAKTPELMQTGTYEGDGVDGREIDVFASGAKPNLVMIKNATSATAGDRHALMNQTNSNDNYSSYLAINTTSEANQIKKLQEGGFIVGTGAKANQLGDTHYWMAWSGAPPAPQGTGTWVMKMDTYTGDGTSDRAISLDFRPDLVLIKQEGATEWAIMRTSMVGGSISLSLASGSAGPTNAITGITDDGFVLGTNSAVNSPGGTYHYQAWGNAYNPLTRTGAADFMIGAYTGNSDDDRFIPTGMEADLIVIKRHNGSSSTSGAVWRTSANSGDETNSLGNSAITSNLIQDITADGFEVGSSAAANSAHHINFWFAFKKGANFNVGKYTGTGSNQTISDLSFQPDFIWIKRDTAVDAVMRPATLLSNSSLRFRDFADFTGTMGEWDPNGFNLIGNSLVTNANGGSYYYVAWREEVGELSVEIVDDDGEIVPDPSVTLSSVNSGFTCQTSTGKLGSSNQKLRITNDTNNPNWAVSIAPTAGSSALWSDGNGKFYDFNDSNGSPAGCADGLDNDSFGGQLTFSPASAIITPRSIPSCSTTGLLRGSLGAFQEGVHDSLTLISGSGADTGCYWDVTDIDISQAIPPQTPSGAYKLNLTMTVVAQ